jgi:catecholate siderophore receptor
MKKKTIIRNTRRGETRRSGAAAQAGPSNRSGHSHWMVVSALAATAAFGLRATADVGFPRDGSSGPPDHSSQVLPIRPGDVLPSFESQMMAALHAVRLAEQVAPALVTTEGKRRQGALARQDTPVLRFAIAPAPLDVVIAAFEKATGLKVELSDPAIRTLASPGISGPFTVEQAISEMLAGTGVTARREGAETVVLELAIVADSIDVTAGVQASSPKYTERLLDTPQTIQVIPQEMMAEQGVSTLRDALRNVSGISIQAGEGGVPAGDNLSIRGFNARTDLFVDGVRDIGGYTRDPYNVEQIEVVKGPASAFAGRGSTGGAVNLASKTPLLRAGQSATLAAGSDAYGRATFDLNRPLPGIAGAAVRLNAMYTHADAPGRDRVESERWGIAPSISFGLGSETQWTLSYSRLDQDNLPDYGIPWVPAANVPLSGLADQPAPVDFENFYGLVDRDYEKTVTGVATVELRHQVNDSLSLRSVLRRGETERDSVITAPRFAGTDTTDIRRTDMKSRDQTDTILTSQTDLAAVLTTGRFQHRLVAGVEVGYETSVNYDRAEVGPEPPATDLFNPTPDDPYLGAIERTGEKTDAIGRSTALYAFDTVDLAPRWQLTGGLRWDRFDLDYDSPDLPMDPVDQVDQVDAAWSWRAGAVFKPTAAGSLYVGAGTSFNPSTEALTLRSSEASLEPERSRSLELGTKWELREGRLSVNAALFQIEKTNARTPGLDPSDPPVVLDGRERVRGAELGLSGRLTERWSASLGYTYLDSEIVASNDDRELGNVFGNAPKHSASLWTTYRLRSRLEVGAGVQYVGDRFNNARATRLAPAYTLYDAMVSYPINEHLTLRLNAYNLADERYIDRVGGGHFIPGPGRSVALSTGFSF